MLNSCVCLNFLARWAKPFMPRTLVHVVTCGAMVQGFLYSCWGFSSIETLSYSMPCIYCPLFINLLCCMLSLKIGSSVVFAWMRLVLFACLVFWLLYVVRYVSLHHQHVLITTCHFITRFGIRNGRGTVSSPVSHKGRPANKWAYCIKQCSSLFPFKPRNREIATWQISFSFHNEGSFIEPNCSSFCRHSKLLSYALCVCQL